jgi:hypothetical protein
MKVIDQLKDLQTKGQWPPETTAKADEILGRKKPAAKSKKTE